MISLDECTGYFMVLIFYSTLVREMKDRMYVKRPRPFQLWAQIYAVFAFTLYFSFIRQPCPLTIALPDRLFWFIIAITIIIMMGEFTFKSECVVDKRLPCRLGKLLESHHFINGIFVIRVSYKTRAYVDCVFIKWAEKKSQSTNECENTILERTNVGMCVCVCVWGGCAWKRSKTRQKVFVMVVRQLCNGLQHIRHTFRNVSWRCGI